MAKKFEGESRWYMTATGGEYSLVQVWSRVISPGIF